MPAPIAVSVSPVLRHLAVALVGACVGLATVAVHREAVPFGLVLAVATSLAVPWWLLTSVAPRTAASSVLGWWVVVGMVALGRPEGDFALASDTVGYVVLGAGVVLAFLAVVSLAGPSGAAR